MSRLRILALTGLLIFALGLALPMIFSLPTWAAEPIKIAIFEPMSGPFSESGGVYAAALQFLAEEINESGGLLGRKVEIIVEDSELKPEVAVAKAEKRIKEGVKFIGMGTGTHVALALQQLAAKEKVIFVTNGAEGKDVTGKFCSPYTFRVTSNTDMRSSAIAHFLATKPYRKFYLINQDYGLGHAAAEGFALRVKQALPDAQIVGEDYHPLANQDFGPYITKILAANPEVIFTSSWGPDLVNLMNQARAKGVTVPFLGYYLNNPTYLKSIKEGTIGSWACDPYMETVRTPANRDFLLRWSQKPKYVAVQKWPGCAMGKAYNGMKFMIEAIKKAGTLDIPTIVSTWEGMSWEGITGPMTMRAEDHQALMPICIAEIVPPTNEFYAFPYVGEPVILPPEKTTVPLKETGCTREKGKF